MVEHIIDINNSYDFKTLLYDQDVYTQLFKTGKCHLSIDEEYMAILTFGTFSAKHLNLIFKKDNSNDNIIFVIPMNKYISDIMKKSVVDGKDINIFLYNIDYLYGYYSPFEKTNKLSKYIKNLYNIRLESNISYITKAIYTHAHRNKFFSLNKNKVNLIDFEHRVVGGLDFFESKFIEDNKIYKVIISRKQNDNGIQNLSYYQGHVKPNQFLYYCPQCRSAKCNHISALIEELKKNKIDSQNYKISVEDYHQQLMKNLNLKREIDAFDSNIISMLEENIKVS